MFKSPITRRWMLLLALPILTATSMARADESERDAIIAAIETVKTKIQATAYQVDEVLKDIDKIEAEIAEYTKLFKESRKKEYETAIEQAKIKLNVRRQTLAQLEDQLHHYYVQLDDLEQQLADMGG
ncbi:MAG TPA: hypothetical protein P5081_13260 [Phycisphaerae bacterium]|nr:hypothetical protein [Phycisphaerae bacterium]HRW53844.1 hypothetical protein [Phycisphaerae bacterium]